MGRIGFWQLLLDDRLSYWEAQRINEAHDAADVAMAAANAAEFSASTRLAALSREVVMLRAAMTVLVRTLKDTKVLDEKLLDARLEAAIAEATTPPDPGPQATWDGMITCLKCRQKVRASTTVMTADGPMCDKCPATAPPAT
jgi:hypothetical protein